MRATIVVGVVVTAFAASIASAKPQAAKQTPGDEMIEKYLAAETDKRQPVEGRRPNLAAITTKVRESQIVRKDDDDVGTGLFRLALRLGDQREILKGQKPRPKISPSQLESPTPLPPPKDGKRPGSDKRSKNSQLVIPEDVTLYPDNLPPGAILKGYEPYVVQELMIQAKATRYLRARYELPDGGSVLAPLPADVLTGNHYGPNLICYILDQHYHVLTRKQRSLLALSSVQKAAIAWCEEDGPEPSGG